MSHTYTVIRTITQMNRKGIGAENTTTQKATHDALRSVNAILLRSHCHTTMMSHAITRQQENKENHFGHKAVVASSTIEP